MQLIDLDSGNESTNYPRASYNNQQQQTQISLDYDQLLAVEQQNEAMKNLEKDIVDVNSIFKDLALLVHDQGEVIGKYFVIILIIFVIYNKKNIYKMSVSL